MQESSPLLQKVWHYHEISKHHLDRYARGPHGLDWANQPEPFRDFSGAKKITLPLLKESLPDGFDRLYRPRSISTRPLNLDSLAVLLQLSLGLSAWKAYRGNKWALRCNPSSGNLHPTEAYVVCAQMPGLSAGVYHYLSRDHTLEWRAQPDDAFNQIFPRGGIIIGLSTIYWREAWKYGIRAYRYCQHDCGHAIAALCYAATALGWQARMLDQWGDGDMAELLGLNRAADYEGAENEAPETLLWLSPRPPLPDAQKVLAGLAQAPWSGRANRLSATHVRWEEIDDISRAAHKPRTAARAPYVPLLLPDLELSGRYSSVSSLIFQRRSAVDFDGQTGCSKPVFFHMMDSLLPRAEIPPWRALPWGPRVHVAIFVHRVAGLHPGPYLLARAQERLQPLAEAMRPEWLWQEVEGCPVHLPLRFLYPHDSRAIAKLVSCHQNIAADGAFSLSMLAEFSCIGEDCPWEYRRLFWEAGMLGHTLYLEAEAAGMRATGIGCYFDDEMHRVLGLKNICFQSFYHASVGGPLEDGRLTTLPAYAHLEHG